jgi:hypothetical protein
MFSDESDISIREKAVSRLENTFIVSMHRINAFALQSRLIGRMMPADVRHVESGDLPWAVGVAIGSVRWCSVVRRFTAVRSDTPEVEMAFQLDGALVHTADAEKLLVLDRVLHELRPPLRFVSLMADGAGDVYFHPPAHSGMPPRDVLSLRHLLLHSGVAMITRITNIAVSPPKPPIVATITDAIIVDVLRADRVVVQFRVSEDVRVDDAGVFDVLERCTGGYSGMRPSIGASACLLLCSASTVAADPSHPGQYAS